MNRPGKFSLFTVLMSLMLAASTSLAAPTEKLGVYELLHVADTGFVETVSMVQQALLESPLTLHGQHDIAVPGNAQRAHIFVLTSPELMAIAATEPPETISGQILRVAVYTHGQSKGTLINMSNPAAHAMVYYSDSPDYSAIVKVAREAAAQIRRAVSGLPGTAMSMQLAPLRTENHYRKYKGDGPARMMTKFRTWKKSQLVIRESGAEDFDEVVDDLARRFREDQETSVEDASSWQLVSMIRVRDDAVYFGISNRFTEDRMIQINSDYRSDGKTEGAPFPGVDHAAALPLEVLVVRKGDRTQVLHYGQMWRMQLYFWDSGYRAFTKNTMIPATISNSIEQWLNK